MSKKIEQIPDSQLNSTELWLAIEDKYAGEEAFSTRKTKGSGVHKNNKESLRTLLNRASESGDVLNDPYLKNIFAAFGAAVIDLPPGPSHHFFGKALEVSAHKANLYRFRGLASLRIDGLHAWDNAYADFEQAREMNPDDPRAPYYIARVLSENGMHEEALFYASEALSKSKAGDTNLKKKIYKVTAHLKQDLGVTEMRPLDLS